MVMCGVARRCESARQNQKPTSCLFVVNFDPQRCTERDLERHFEPYGKLERVQIRRNFAFVQYETVEQATEALNNVNKSRLLGRVISCEYVVNTEGRSGGRNGGREMSRSRSRSRSPFGRDRPRSHSISPVPVGGAYSSGRENGRNVSRSPIRGGRYSRSRSRSPYGRSPSRSPRSHRSSRSP
eukprot:jgi/Botrbrau1/16167/Bobra.0272s0004.1